MIDPAFTLTIDQHGDDIETGRHVKQPVGGKVHLGHPGDLHSFSRRDRLAGGIPAPGQTALDLDEDGAVAVPGDDIDLAPPLPIIAGQDLVSQAGKMGCGQILAFFAEGDTLIGQIPAPPGRSADVPDMVRGGRWPCDAPASGSLYGVKSRNSGTGDEAHP